jgi:enolase
MAKIKHIWAREILDSRGIPTIEAACMLDSGEIAVSSVPAGTSMGSHEALELRDADNPRYLGQGVLRAVENVNNILGPALVGENPTEQAIIDKKMIGIDGTENKSKLGANAILSVSEAVVRTGAMAAGMPLYGWIYSLASIEKITASVKIPIPLFNMINGGKHGAGNLDFQEFWVVPASNKSFVDGLQMSAEIYQTIGINLSRRGAIQLGRDIFLGLDVAANSFYKDGSYWIKDKSEGMSDDQFMEYYKGLYDQYKIAIIEDAFQEDAWDSWKKLYSTMGNDVLIVGDDLLVTNPKRVQKAIAEKACNGAVIKPNQIGTVSETLQVVKLVKEAGWKVIVSHRSGETNDSFIADFAVGVAADYIKSGAPARGERVAKYNRLSTIEAELSRMK